MGAASQMPSGALPPPDAMRKTADSAPPTSSAPRGYTSGPFLQMHSVLKPGSEQTESAWHFPIA
jgi:hypothetical protein